MKILIADDSSVSRLALEVPLRKWGYEVISVSDGKQAWEVLQGENPPALAILDWMMPGMTGLDICRSVRELAQDPYTYLLLLTSKNQREDFIEGMEAGADDYLSKPFDQRELRVRLRACARVVEVQTQMLASREALRDQATKDGLTCIWNRSAILDILRRELARSARELTPVGLVLADLDHFKSVNDNHGHLAGDTVLQEAAWRMSDCIRVYDAIGRYGGEEFLIVLPGCDQQSTFQQAERMRAHLAQDVLVVNEARLTLTGSFGCTTVAPAQQATAEALIRTADQALYLAKRQGRNRVELLSSAPELNVAHALQRSTLDVLVTTTFL